MAYFRREETNDWCHLCGGRSRNNVAIWYPNNAEHERLDRPCSGVSRGNGYFRICARCGADLVRVGTGEVSELVADRPGGYPKKHVVLRSRSAGAEGGEV